jgi:hypothetical protein
VPRAVLLGTPDDCQRLYVARDREANLMIAALRGLRAGSDAEGWKRGRGRAAAEAALSPTARGPLMIPGISSADYLISNEPSASFSRCAVWQLPQLAPIALRASAMPVSLFAFAAFSKVSAAP